MQSFPIGTRDAVVDDADYAACVRHSWSLGSTGKPFTLIDGRPIFLHEFVLRLRAARTHSRVRRVTPVDGDWLHCTSANLKERRPPVKGKVKMAGIVWVRGRYSVRFWHGGRRNDAGSYETLAEAVAVRDAAFATHGKALK